MSMFDKVKSIIVEQLGVDPAEVTMDANIITDLGADSFDMVELTMLYEEEFSIEIPDDVALNLKAVQMVVDYLKAERGDAA